MATVSLSALYFFLNKIQKYCWKVFKFHITQRLMLLLSIFGWTSYPVGSQLKNTLIKTIICSLFNFQYGFDVVPDQSGNFSKHRSRSSMHWKYKSFRKGTVCILSNIWLLIKRTEIFSISKPLVKILATNVEIDEKCWKLGNKIRLVLN